MRGLRLLMVPRLALLAASTLVACAAVPLLVIQLGLDWWVVRKLLYYQTTELPVHKVVLDDTLFYRLKPNTEFDKGRVHINNLGFRGHAADPAKAAGTFRIACVGASNVYGLNLEDHQTWPAQLEALLLRRYHNQFEVWNAGTCGYVPSQDMVIAREILDRYDPDLFIIGLTNRGSPPLLANAPVEQYFEQFPRLWEKVFYQELPGGKSERLICESRLYRFFRGALYARQRAGWYTNPAFESENALSLQAFTGQARRQGLPVVIFLFPGALPEKYQDLFDGTAAVVLSLTGAELPEEYRNVHPNARVMTWYAEEIAAFLAAKGLIPGELREPTARQDQGAAKPSETPDVRVAPEETILPGGAFLMGCSPEDEDCEADERPARVVRLSPFAIERKEVTNDAYRRCVQAGACTEPRWKNWYRAKPGDHPVVGVTQPQAEAYCAWAGKSLPTEAQWEYATRAGGTARAYGPPDATAWFYRNSDRSTHPVAQKTPNAWGLYDLYGNAWEWVQDQYSRTFSTGADVVDPVNTGRNEQLIVRGGGWFTHDRYLRASYRSARYSTTFSSAEIGFRCVRNVNPATGR